MNRQKLALFILLIVLVLAAVRSYIIWPRQKTAPSLKFTQGQKGVPGTDTRSSSPTAKAGQDEGRRLRLDLLDQEQTAFKGYRRNIFKPVFIDEIMVMKRKAAAPKIVLPPAQPQKPAPVPVQTVVPATQADIQRRELARFTFLGFLKKDNRKTIFLAKDKDIILVKKGDAFAGRYEASEITDQALTIRVTDTREEIVIPLMENRPLSSY